MKKTIILLFAIFNTCIGQYNPNLYEIMGQSNARGQENSIYLNSIGLAGKQAGEYIFTTLTTSFQQLEGGVNNTGLAPFGTFGVEMRLMKLLRDYYNTNQFLIKYAVGGTQLGISASVLDWNISSSGEYYDSSNIIHNLALIALNDNRPPRAFIWIQGENDCYGTESQYQTNLQNFIAAKRSYYGYSNMPFVVVRMGNLQTAFPSTAATLVKAAQTTVGGQPNNILIDADGAPVQADGGHYTYVGYDTIANRIFRALIALSYPTILRQGKKSYIVNLDNNPFATTRFKAA